jgi:oligopeptide transport system ATP-binding protein
METLLEIRDVSKHFPVSAGGLFRKGIRILKAVENVNFSITKGACFGIVGESGSGKTTLARLILLLEKVTRGSIIFEGMDVQRFTKREQKWYRTRVQTVFQDAASSLNPRMRIRDIVGEPLLVHRKSLSKEEIVAKTKEILRLVGLGPASLNMFPHELSGGQKQRVAIARAIVLEPSLIILDEPVSALDVSIRAQILNLLSDIKEREGLTYVIIAHDLAMLEHVTTAIAVIYLGKIVEMGDAEEVFANPLHPYTKALFASIPQPIPGRGKKTFALSGEIGSPLNLPPGCRFHPRCNQAQSDCQEIEPALVGANGAHQVACHRVHT